MQDMPAVLKKAIDTAESMNQVMETVRKNSKNLEGLTEPLGQRGEMLVNRLDEGTKKLNLMVDEMLHFSRMLNSPDSSLGQLLNNPELCQHINRTVKNIDDLTRQLKPIINDARVFTDKIARHPAMLGVRGALQKNPGIK